MAALRARVSALRERLVGRVEVPLSRVDAVLASVLAVLAGIVGGVSVARGEPGQYYQNEFQPAAMRACGHGFAGYGVQEGPFLEFLRGERQSVDCSVLEDQTASLDANVFQRAHRYLLESAGLLWRLDGISWDALTPLFAVLYGLSAAALFGLFRLVSGRVLATIGTLALIFSPLQLDELRHLRDYAKVPFLFAAFFLAGVLATKRLRPRSALVVGAAAGAVLGIGFGFRADVLLALPILLGALVLWPEGWRQSVRVRLATAAVMGGVFVLTALPVILTLSSGGNLYLMGVHGQTAPFTDNLGLEQDLYSTGRIYNDPYAVSLTNAHDLLVDGRPGA